MHEILGLTIAALLLIRMMLALTSLPGASWQSLLPWLFSDGRKQLGREIQAQMAGWKQARLAPPEDGEAVARSVHGFILLCGIGMGITGVVLYFGWNQTAPQTNLIEMVAETHELLVGLLEALVVRCLLCRISRVLTKVLTWKKLTIMFAALRKGARAGRRLNRPSGSFIYVP